MIYFEIDQLIRMCSSRNVVALRRLLVKNLLQMQKAPGSSHNHQAWKGGYLDHVREVMNIAVWLRATSPREYPFTLADALEVLFLHDLEKPWKFDPEAYSPLGISFKDFEEERHAEQGEHPKQVRKDFRAALIYHYGIVLTEEQQNALEYVEGIPDSQYKAGERVMGEMAAFCHCCDILSARLWHDKGREHQWIECCPHNQHKWKFLQRELPLVDGRG